MSKKKLHNMAITHPRLLKWFASENPFWVLLKIIPLLVLYILSAKTVSAFSVTPIIFFGTGLLTWSLFEYVTHRWFYHKVYKSKALNWFLESFHLHHHHDLKDYRVLNAGVFLIYPIAILFWLVVFSFTNVAWASYFGLGTMAYYFFYENVHYFIHYKKYDKGYMQFIQQYHLYHHHKNWNKNYGNTTTFWDKVFGTYDRGYKQFELNEQQIQELIKKQ